MKPTSYPTAPTDHQSRVDLALKRLLNAPNPYLRTQATHELGKILTRPQQLLSCSHLQENHPIYRQALAVADAWEAVCNGMPTAELFEALDEIPPHSPLRPWREAALSIHFFYASLEEAAAYHAQLIPKDWPLAVIVQVVKSGNHLYNAQGSLRQLLQQVLRPDTILLETLQALLDAQETGLEEVFLSSWEELARRWPEEDQEELKSLNIWLWTQMAWQDFEERRLLRSCMQIWGEPEALRLAALGCLGWDPEAALLYWGRFLLTARRENSLTDVQRNTATEILWNFVHAVADFQAEHGIYDDWETDWANLANVWNEDTTEVRHKWPTSWAQMRLHEAGQPFPSRTKVSRTTNTGQLELFDLNPPLL
ncbi:MAG: hypothetical protein HKM06_09450 [Spirochaetales bacterium]|nr:hypothetical protein [Spirochaetales bacterium]